MRRRPASSASYRRRRTTTPTYTKTATCRSCSASPGPALPCTPACCRVVPPRTVAFACPWTSPSGYSTLTDVGMRVVIVRNDIALADFDHPQLFKSSAARNDLPARPSSTSSRPAGAGSPDQLQALKSIAASKASDAEAAATQGHRIEAYGRAEVCRRRVCHQGGASRGGEPDSARTRS